MTDARLARPYQKLRSVAAGGLLILRKFFTHGMTVYAGALAYRGLLALVPSALLFVWLLGLFGMTSSLPRLTAALLRLRAEVGDPDVAVRETLSVGGLLSLGSIIGIWSIGTGARLLMRALNAAHEIEETRGRVMLVAFSLVFLPGLAVGTVLATLLLLVTSEMIVWAAGLLEISAVVSELGSWLRIPVALGLLGVAVSAIYRFGPSVRPRFRAVASGAAVAVSLWAITSFAFSFALSTVLDYGSTYGSLAAGVALLVYLNLSAGVLLLGAEVSAGLSVRC